jgi:hypothetical protein
MICLQGARQGDGLEMGWHKNGQKSGEGTCKDGKKVETAEDPRK